jgi:hypothetical protein
MEVFYQNRPGAITPGEAATIAAVVDTFVRATETSDVERRLKIIETELPAHPENVSEMFGAGRADNSIHRRESALDPC